MTSLKEQIFKEINQFIADTSEISLILASVAMVLAAWATGTTIFTILGG